MPEPLGQRSKVPVVGWSASGVEIGSFVRRLDDSALFDEVNLRYKRPEAVLGRNVVEFLVVCRMPEFE